MMDDYQVNSSSTTKQFFNNFFTKNYSISANANDAVVSYFEEYTGSQEAGQQLARAVIYTSLSQEIDPMSVIDQFSKMSKGEIDDYLAMYLNLNRVGSSLIGTSNQPLQNKYVQRCILP